MAVAALSVLGSAGCRTRGIQRTAAGFPVLAWIGPPAEQTTPERYRELADAGFTISFSGFPNADAMQRALEVAHAQGVRLMVSCPELRSDPEATVRRFMGHPGVAGYYLRDEPGAGDFAELGRWVRRIRAVDDAHPCYINLFPTYASEAQLGTPTYQEHVDRFLAEVPVQVLSFDHYPIVRDRVRADWYENLEIASAAARRAGLPLWAFALAVAHDPYPIATVDGLRLQVFSNLAYGAQALQYFTYWTPTSTTWNFHQAPLESDGTRTAVYERVRQVNAELRALGPWFLGARLLAVGHLGPSLPRGTRAYTPSAPVRTLDTGGRGAVVSRLRNGDSELLLVQNRELSGVAEVALQFDPEARVRVLGRDGKPRRLRDARFREHLTPGDARVFVWDGGRDRG